MSLFDAGGRDLSPQSLSAAELPVGFGVERYARIWERNPFTLVTPDVRPAQASPFNNLFFSELAERRGRRGSLCSKLGNQRSPKNYCPAWPNQATAHRDASESEPAPSGGDHFDGKEEAGIKFRFGAGQTASDVAQMPNNDAAAQMPNATELAPKALRNTPENLSNAQSSGLPKTASAEAPDNAFTRVSRGFTRKAAQDGQRLRRVPL